MFNHYWRTTFNDVKPNEYLRAELDELYTEKGIEGLREYASH